MIGSNGSTAKRRSIRFRSITQKERRTIFVIGDAIHRSRSRRQSLGRFLSFSFLLFFLKRSRRVPANGTRLTSGHAHCFDIEFRVEDDGSESRERERETKKTLQADSGRVDRPTASNQPQGGVGSIKKSIRSIDLDLFFFIKRDGKKNKADGGFFVQRNTIPLKHCWVDVAWNIDCFLRVPELVPEMPVFV